METKIHAFEYLLSKLIKWHKEVSGETINDLSVLKSLKLLFFISAVNTKITSEDSLLDIVFNNFVAMPYGHVESNVYDNIKSGSHPNLTINNRSSFLNEDYQESLSDDIKQKIDSSIEALREENEKIILLSSFELVELSHRWYSWKAYFKKAQASNINSSKIPVTVIKNEEKFYSL